MPRKRGLTESQTPHVRVYRIIVKGIVWKRIVFSKSGSSARDMGIILAARQCFYVDAMYLRCSAPRFRKIYALPHNTFDDDPVNSNI